MKNQVSVWVLIALVVAACTPTPDSARTQTMNDLIERPWMLETELESRSISFENPTGERGAGGTAASPLGVGRKGAPARGIAPGETVQLCDIEGPGTIRHIWMTTFNVPLILRSAVIRAYWDGQQHPSLEVPLGDFFGFAHGKVTAYESAVHSVGENAALNFWLAMPFHSRARLTLTNDAAFAMPLFYQVDYTVGDAHDDGIGRLHALFRRDNPTALAEDFELLPCRSGRGRLIGSVIGVRTFEPQWWGEGEVKIYLDGDDEFATIVGTGSEDYVGLSFGMQETPFRYHGASLNREGFVSMYRWHLPDPVFWREKIRVTIQQIGHHGTSSAPEDYFDQLYERQDDWSTATFWYEPVPSAPLPELPGLEARTADLWPEVDPRWAGLVGGVGDEVDH